MMKKQPTLLMTAGLLALMSGLICVTPALAHHALAMYDQTKTLVLTGVAYQFVAQANHAELHFYLIGPDGKLVYEGAIDDRPTPDPATIEGATNYVRAALVESMAGKPVTVATTRPYGCSIKY